MAYRGSKDALLLLSQLPLQPDQLLSSLHSFRFANMHICYRVNLRQQPTIVLFYALQCNSGHLEGCLKDHCNCHVLWISNFRLL